MTQSAPVVPSTRTSPVKAVSIGVGAIGQQALETAANRTGISVVGAVDPARAGERVGGVDVVAEMEAMGEMADVALVATGSSLAAVADQFEAAARAGLNVVSTCEELTYPWFQHPEVAERLDAVARENDVAILGCGVNPGFLMDVLPGLLASASSGVSRARILRQANLARRRPQLQAKVGVGLSEEEWRERAERDRFGHVGLVESAIVAAIALGWEIGPVAFTRDPLVRDGLVVGIREEAVAADPVDRELSLTLVFELDGVDEDVVELDGDPGCVTRIDGGLQGDAATVACMLHAAEVVSALPAGMRLPIEAPIWAGPVRA